MTGEEGPDSRIREGSGLEERFVRRLRRHGFLREGDRVLVALSGGLDSMVLLHLLRFGRGLPPLQLRAAHFDHRMRGGSRADALWVRGVCRAWGVSLEFGEAREVPTSEEEAREARYAFLVGRMREWGARWLLTAHHGDDQAETVLFRILRGTGLRGLAGIPLRRPPGLYRPLLPFTRDDLQGHARVRGIPYRDDPSNRELTIPRNVLRHEILPRLEGGPAPRARDALRRLARLARENEEGWASLMPDLVDPLLIEESEAEGGGTGPDDQGDGRKPKGTGGEGKGREEEEIVVARPPFLAYHPAVQARVLREVLLRCGIRLDEAGTRAALEFTRTGASGGSIALPGGLRLSREFQRLRIAREPETDQDRPLLIEGPEAGSGTVMTGGRRLRVTWGPSEPRECLFVVGLDRRKLLFPLRIRSWTPGDRILMAYGTKKLTKLLAEARVPKRERGRIPVAVDREGRVLCVGALAIASDALAGPEPASFFLGFRDDDRS